MNGVRVNTTARSERLHIVNGAKETEAMQRKWTTQGRTQKGTTCEVRKHEKPRSESAQVKINKALTSQRPKPKSPDSASREPWKTTQELA